MNLLHNVYQILKLSAKIKILKVKYQNMYTNNQPGFPRNFDSLYEIAAS